MSWNFVSGAKSGTPGTTGTIANWSAQTFTDSNTAASGTAASYTGFSIQRPTLVATAANVTTTDAATLYIPNAPLASTNQTITNAYAMWVDDGAVRLDGALTVAGAITASSTIAASGRITMNAEAVDHAQASVAAHATTTAIWAGGGNEVLLTGAVVTITDFPDAPQAGAVRWVRANDAHIITDNAAIEVQGNTNYTCTANDVLRVYAKSTTEFKVDIFKSDGTSVVPTTIGAADTTTQGKVELSTDAEAKTRTSTSVVLTPANLSAALFAPDNYTTTTSGATSEITSMPSWLNFFVLTFWGCGGNGTNNLLIRLGDSTSYKSTGYLSCSTLTTNSAFPVSVSNTTGIIVQTNGANIHGSLFFVRSNADQWTCEGGVIPASGAINMKINGALDVADTLTRVQILWNGANNFDAGAWGINW